MRRLPAFFRSSRSSASKTSSCEYALLRRPLDYGRVRLRRRGDRAAAGRQGIEAFEDQGWAWFELDRIDAARGGAPEPKIDALRLLAVLLAHWDNKGANQRLICPPVGS